MACLLMLSMAYGGGGGRECTKRKFLKCLIVQNGPALLSTVSKSDA